MPKIPQYAPGQVSLRGLPESTIPKQGVSAPADAFGAAQAQAMGSMASGLESIGSAFTKLALAKKEEEDAQVAMDAYTKASDEARDVLYNPETGLMNRRGKNAKGVYSEAETFIDEAFGRYAEGMNANQLRAFQAMWSRKRASVLDGAAGHESKEFEAWKADNTKAMVTGSIQDAVDNYENPKAIANAMQVGEAAIRANSAGASADVIKEQVEAFKSTLHKSVIDRMVIADPRLAKDYYKANEDEIDGTVKTDIEKVLKSEGEAQRGQEIATIATSKFDTETDALDWVRKNFEGDIEDDAVKRVKARFEETRRINAQMRVERLDSLTASVLDAPTLEAALDVARKSEYGTDRKALETLARSRFKTILESDPKALVVARARIDAGLRGDPKGITSEPALYRDFAGKVSKEDFEKLSTYLRNGGAAAEIKDSTVAAIFKRLTDKKAEDVPEKYQLVWDYVVANVPVGAKPTDDMIKGLMTQALMSGEREGGGLGYGSDMTYAEALEKGFGDSWLPGVSRDEERRIANILKNAGKLVNSRTIRLYKKHIDMGLALPKRTGE